MKNPLPKIIGKIIEILIISAYREIFSPFLNYRNFYAILASSCRYITGYFSWIRVRLCYTMLVYERQQHRTGRSRSQSNSACWNGWPRGIGSLIPVPSLPNIYFRLSGFQSSFLITHFRIPVHTAPLSDMWHSTFEIGAAELRSVTEMAPKSPILWLLFSY